MNKPLLHKIFRSIIYLQILISTTLNAQWVPLQYPGVVGGDFPVINEVDFVSETTGLAVSDNGLIVRTTNRGVDWDTVYTIPDTYTFQDVIFFSDARAIAVGHRIIDPACVPTASQGVIAISIDSGMNWDASFVDFNLNAVDFSTAQIGYIGGDCGRILKTTDGGDNWSELPNAGTFENILDVENPSELVGYFSLSDNTILKTTTGAGSWSTVVPGGNITGKIQFFSDEEGVCVFEDVTNDFRILATENGGDSWSSFSPFAGNELIFMLDHTRGYTGPPGAGLVAYIEDSGASINFLEAVPPAPEAWPLKRTIHFYDEQTGYIAGANTFYRLQLPEHNLSGTIYDDQNADCLLTSGEVGFEDWIVKIEKQGVLDVFQYTTTDENGAYNFTVDTGNYVLNVFPPNDTRNLCDNNIVVDLSEWEGNSILDIGSGIDSLCPVMEIDIATTMLSRCVNNTYFVSYKNKGTSIAENPHITLLFDEDLEVISSVPNWTDGSGGLFTYELDDLLPGQSGSIELEVLLNCTSTIEGQTHSVIAKIFPDNICDTLAPAWDQSSIKVSAECVDDSLTLQIENIGDDMQSNLEYIVIEDHILLQRGNFDLGSTETTAFVFYPNGGTLRLEANQSEGHPGRSMPSVAVEGCGTDEDGNFSLGFVTQDPEDDLNPFISIEHQESIDSSNMNIQNLIFAYPKGFGDDQYIKPNTSVEYRIPFKVPFFVPANNYRVLSFPSPFQEIETFIPGVSSHDYDYFISGQDSIHFIIKEDLMEGELGFIKFRIDQKVDNPDGTPILNQFVIDIPIVDSVLCSGNYLHNVLIDSLATPNALIVSGNVILPTGLPIGEVLFNIDDNALSTSNVLGVYETVIPGINSQHSLSINPSKVSSFVEGVSAYDLYLLHEYFNGRYTPDTPFQLLAADWNKDHQLDHQDLLAIHKAIGQSNQLNLEYGWQFIPSNYSFSLTNPIEGTIPSTYSISNPTLNNVANFKGIKYGDFNLSVQPNNSINSDTTTLSTLTLGIEEQLLKAGQSYDIPFQFDNLNGDLLSFQWMLHYNADQIEVLDILPELLSNDRNIENLQLNYSTPGSLIISWYRSNAEINTDSLAFQLKIKANTDLNIKDIWTIERDLLFPEAFVKTGAGVSQKNEITLEIKKTTEFSDVLNVHPNPGHGLLKVNYHLEEDQAVELRLYNSLGQLVRRYNKVYNYGGNNEFYIDASRLNTGAYFLYLEGANTKIKAMKKIIFID